MKIAFLDLETTGFANSCGIHQIFILLVDNGKIIGEISHDCDPGDVQFNQEALTLANKTISDIRAHKHVYEVKELIDDTLLFLLDTPDDKWTICAYNAHFDKRFWKNLYDEHRQVKGEAFETFEQIYHTDEICVCKMARTYFKEKGEKPASFKLADVARYVGLEVETSSLHTAKCDALLAYQLYNFFTNQNQEA